MAADGPEATLSVMQAILHREGLRTTRRGGMLLARRTEPAGSCRLLLRHSLDGGVGAARLLIEPSEYIGPGVATALGPALAAGYGMGFRGALPIRADVWLAFDIQAKTWEQELMKHPPPVRGALVNAGAWPGDRPALLTGARGRLRLRVGLDTGDRHVPPPRADEVAGTARNALGELANVLGGLSEPRTGTPLASLVAEAEDMTIAEAQQFALSGFDAGRWAQAQGLRLSRQVDPLEVMEALWARPAIEMLALEATAPKGCIPVRAEGIVAFYLVPHMRTELVLERLTQHLRERVPDITVEVVDQIDPWEGRLPGPLADALREGYRAGFGSRAVLVRQAEPLPPVAAYRSALKGPVGCLSTVQPGHLAGTARERMSWEDLVKTATTYGSVLNAWATLLENDERTESSSPSRL